MRVPPGRGVVRPAAGLAHARGGEGLLLRLLERGPLAAVPHRPHPAASSAARTGAHYQAVNRRFADAVCEEVDSDDPIVLVQDYHFALLPADDPRAAAARDHHHLLAHPLAERRALRHLPLARRAARRAARQQHPRLPHPVPLQQLPRRASTASSRRASTASRTRSSTRARATLVRPYPISIEWPSALAGEPCRPSPSAARASSPSSGSPPDALLGVGVDRLDYTKGIEERLLAVERLLERLPALRGPLHLRAARRAEPHRHRALPAAQRERRAQLAARINERFGVGRLPARDPAARAPRAARPSSATTAPPTSATSAACTTA